MTEGRHCKTLGHRVSKLVDFVCYCLNPNHFHFIVKKNTDEGIKKLMIRLGGFSKYFNGKYKRSGTLFQGIFKVKHVDSNDYLLYLSAYVNLNDRVHQLGHPVSKLISSKSSWGEYTENGKDGICFRNIILDQFKNKGEYKKFAEDALEIMLENKRN